MNTKDENSIRRGLNHAFKKIFKSEELKQIFLSLWTWIAKAIEC